MESEHVQVGLLYVFAPLDWKSTMEPIERRGAGEPRQAPGSEALSRYNSPDALWLEVYD